MILTRTFRTFTDVLIVAPALLAWGWLALRGVSQVSPEIARRRPVFEMMLYNAWIPWAVAIAVLGLSVLAGVSRYKGWRVARIMTKATLLFSLIAFWPYVGGLTLMWWWP